MNRGRTTLGATDSEIRATLAAPLSDLDPDAGYELRHEHFVAGMPQSGQPSHGREAMREPQRSFPPETKPTFTVRRITGSGDLRTVEAEGDYGGQIFHVAATLDLGSGKILCQTRYYAEPFEAPQWRAHLVERMGSSVWGKPRHEVAASGRDTSPRGCARRARGGATQRRGSAGNTILVFDAVVHANFPPMGPSPGDTALSTARLRDAAGRSVGTARDKCVFTKVVPHDVLERSSGSAKTREGTATLAGVGHLYSMNPRWQVTGRSGACRGLRGTQIFATDIASDPNVPLAAGRAFSVSVIKAPSRRPGDRAVPTVPAVAFSCCASATGSHGQIESRDRARDA
jgi:hypothetical protein